jgi:hypothetical protein
MMLDDDRNPAKANVKALAPRYGLKCQRTNPDTVPGKKISTFIRL